MYSIVTNCLDKIAKNHMVSELIDNLVKFSNINFKLLKDSMHSILILINYEECIEETCEQKILELVFK